MTIKRSATAEEVQHYIRARVSIQELTGCWIWNLSCDGCGYGYVSNETRAYRFAGTILAHRVSFSAFNGEIPEGHFVRHRCNNPSCVNPLHLRSGTKRENEDDKLETPRQRTTAALLNMKRKIERELPKRVAQLEQRTAQRLAEIEKELSSRGVA